MSNLSVTLAAGQNLSVIAARCHLPYRGEALAYRKVSPLHGNLTSSPEAPLLGELSPKVTERLYEGQPDRETQKSPLGVHGSLGAFRLVSSMEHSRNSIFSICDSPQKSSAARKVYRADRQTSPQCARFCSFSSKSVLYWSCGLARRHCSEGRCCPMAYISTFILSVAANVASYYICKWLDGWLKGRKH